MKNYYILLFTLLIGTVTSGYSQKISKNKKAGIASVENHKTEHITISDKIWAEAELAFQESKSSKLLADYAGKNGFTVEKAVAKMPTTFVASYGSGSLVIGILGEFDALPGISRKAQPTKAPLKEGAKGHKGMVYTAKAMAMADLYKDSKLVKAVKAIIFIKDSFQKVFRL
ncbi:MAG: hypothetical protein AAF934_12620 [Bacteroidota bacterium]